MNDNLILESLKKFLIENVANKFKLEKPQEGNILDEKYELVNPAVYIGWIPPKNYLVDYGYDVPALLIMEDGGEDSGDESNINIRIGIATFDPGQTDSNRTTPNTKGYKDLLNIITRIRMEFAKVSIIEDTTTIQKPIKWGLYEEQNYPYWNGWLSFQASAMPLNLRNQGIEKFL